MALNVWAAIIRIRYPSALLEIYKKVHSSPMPQGTSGCISLGSECIPLQSERVNATLSLNSNQLPDTHCGGDVLNLCSQGMSALYLQL